MIAKVFRNITHSKWEWMLDNLLADHKYTWINKFIYINIRKRQVNILAPIMFKWGLLNLIIMGYIEGKNETVHNFTSHYE